MRYRYLAARKVEGFNVTDACAAAEVSRSAFYAWQAADQGPTAADWDEALLINQIRELHAALNGTYGEPRMTPELADKDWVLNRKRTARLMRQEKLRGHRPRCRRSLTKADEDAPACPDLVGRHFQPELLDTVWCGDMTYIRTGEGWLYLATVIDLASRHLICWTMGTRHEATLVVDALKMAVASRGRRKMDGTIFHHDRGSEGGFKGSSQHPGRRDVRGKTSWVNEGVDGPVGDEVGWGTVSAAGGRSGVLAGDRNGSHNHEARSRSASRKRPAVDGSDTVAGGKTSHVHRCG